ncbi:MAG: PilZ domain-containing protein [Candidatus Omnitrophota bacterium]
MKIISRIFNLQQKELKAFANDRRDTKRYEIPLKLTYKDPENDLTGESMTKNISRTGLRFPVIKKIPKGASLKLKIEDPNTSKFISSPAKVVWVEEFAAEDNAEKTIYEIGVKLPKKKLF